MSDRERAEFVHRVAAEDEARRHKLQPYVEEVLGYGQQPQGGSSTGAGDLALGLIGISSAHAQTRAEPSKVTGTQILENTRLRVSVNSAFDLTATHSRARADAGYATQVGVVLKMTDSGTLRIDSPIPNPYVLDGSDMEPGGLPYNRRVIMDAAAVVIALPPFARTSYHEAVLAGRTRALSKNLGAVPIFVYSLYDRRVILVEEGFESRTFDIRELQ